MLEKKVYISSFSSEVETGQITLTEEIEIFEDGVSLGTLRPRMRAVSVDPGTNYIWVPEYATYEVGDIVSHSDERWLCLTSNTQEVPSVTAVDWEPLPVVSKAQLFFESVRKVVEEVTKTNVELGEFDAEEMTEARQLYPRWKVGTRFSVNDVVFYNDTLYRCVQAHTSQSTWIPTAVPALWTPTVAAGVIPEWTQPTGAHDAYNTGDRVIFEGSTYESLIDGNTFSPTAYPAGWQLIN